VLWVIKELKTPGGGGETIIDQGNWMTEDFGTTLGYDGIKT
jgi:hypothetical protein